MTYYKDLATELQQLIGDEVRVRRWLVNYEHECIEFTKGDKTIRVWPSEVVSKMNPKTGVYNWIKQQQENA
jgi:hypothetical protein